MSQETVKSLKCCICDNDRSSFYCSACISTGNFTSNNDSVYITFDERKKHLIEFNARQLAMDESFASLLAEDNQQHELEQRVNERRLKIHNLRKAIAYETKRKENLDKSRHKLSESERQLKRNITDLKEKLSEISRQTELMQVDMKRLNDDRENILHEVKRMTRHRLAEMQLIFPLKSHDAMEQSSEEQQTSMSSTTPSMDSWAKIHSSQRYYGIVDTWLPDGDVYECYHDWSMKHGSNRMSDAIEIKSTRDNDAYRISAALAYLTRLINLQSYLTDCQLPKKVSSKDFYKACNQSGNEQYLDRNEFLHSCAKLNANIFFLCLSQGIPSDKLIPNKPFKNMIELLGAECGMTHAVIIDDETDQRLEECLGSDYMLQDESWPELACDIDNDAILNEWEPIHLSGSGSSGMGVLTGQQSEMMIQDQSQPNVFSSIITSFARSFFR